MNLPIWSTVGVAFVLSLLKVVSDPSVGFKGFAVTFFFFPFWAVLLITFLLWLFASIRESFLFRLARTYWVKTSAPDVSPAQLPVFRRNRAPSTGVVHHDITSASPLTPGRSRFPFNNE